MVAHAVVDFFVVGDIAQAPVGIQGVRGELRQTPFWMFENRRLRLQLLSIVDLVFVIQTSV